MSTVEKLVGKRLLLLGGSMWKEAIAMFAKEHGVTLIATGNNRNAGIFEIADECYDVDSTDSEAMKKLIVEKNIDGVYMGGSEPVISAACQYLNELNMPCYCTKEQWDFLENKYNFKELCICCGLPVVPKYEVTGDDPEMWPEIEYPVITKPQDGCGSQGFSVCRNHQELIIGYRLARDASPTGRVIVEKFVKNDSVVVFYTFSNAEAYFSGLENKYPVHYKEQGSYVAGIHLFESSFSTKFRSQFESKIKEMFKRIGVKEGTAWIEVFHEGDKYYFNEVGYRYSGSVSVYPVDYFYGINQVACDIYYALTGESVHKGHQSLIPEGCAKKTHYCVYPLHMKAGQIQSIDGIEDLMKRQEFIFIAITKNVKDIVKSSGTVSQVFAFVHFVFDTIDECEKTVGLIHDTLKVLDPRGENLIHQMLNFDERKILL